MKKFVIFLVVISKLVFAADPKLYLLHINGLNTTQKQSQLNQQKYLSVYAGSKSVNWDVIYNPTQSSSEWNWVASIKGFIDVCIQKWYEINQLPTFDEFTQQAMKAQGVDYPVGSKEYKLFQSNLVSQFQQLLLDDDGKNMGTIVDEFHNVVPAQYAGVLGLLSHNGITDYLNSKDYVILLPHSQGNIYANNLYNYLIQTEHFDSSRISIFGYASPAKSESGQMDCNSLLPNYLTSTNDGVIASSRLIFGASNVLANNITILKNQSDPTGHGLIENYLSDKGSINNLNTFLNITSNNCFKELHPTERIASVINVGAQIIYDKSSKTFVEFAKDPNGRTLCELSLDNPTGWTCATNASSKITNISMSVATDGNGQYYMTGYGESGDYLITYKHGVGFISERLLTGGSSSGGTLYYSNGLLYSVYMNLLKVINIGNSSVSQIAVFQDIIMLGVNNMAIDSVNNIYIAPPVPSYMNPVQVYSQNIESGSPVLLFGSRMLDYIISDLTITNNTLFACSGTKIYYLPLNSPSNIPWLILNSGCSQILGDDENLFTTYGGDLFRYKL